MLPRKIVGVEQTGDVQSEHTTLDLRPLVTMALYALITAAAVITPELIR